jgi:hypothetical protein
MAAKTVPARGTESQMIPQLPPASWLTPQPYGPEVELIHGRAFQGSVPRWVVERLYADVPRCVVIPDEKHAHPYQVMLQKLMFTFAVGQDWERVTLSDFIQWFYDRALDAQNRSDPPMDLLAERE